MMVHAKNYETVSTLVKVMQKKPWSLFFRTWFSVVIFGDGKTEAADGSQTLSFKRPSLSVDEDVCLSLCEGVSGVDSAL